MPSGQLKHYRYLQMLSENCCGNARFPKRAGKDFIAVPLTVKLTQKFPFISRFRNWVCDLANDMYSIDIG